MTHGGKPSQPIQANGALTAPLVVWLGAQLLALALAAMRIPLWANAPRVTELLALQYVLIIQIAVSSLIFPWLMQSTASAAVVIATAWPMVFFAGLLSPAPISTLFCCGAYITGWLFALAILQSPLSSTGLSLVTPIAALWACGGPLLQFLNLEYGKTPLRDGLLERVTLGPTVAALRLIKAEIGTSFEVLAVAVIASIIVAAVTRVGRNRRATGNLGRV